MGRDTADGDSHGVAGVMLDVLEVEKVLPQFRFADLVRRLMIMCGQLAYGSGVRSLARPRSCRHSIILFRSSVMVTPPEMKVEQPCFLRQNLGLFTEV
jgi:hypothetical protein